MTTTDARKRINERSDEVTGNRVTITMTDGTTREVHPDTPVRWAGGYAPLLARPDFGDADRDTTARVRAALGWGDDSE